MARRAKSSITENMNLLLEEMMEDAALYPCVSVQAGHAILLQQIELGHSSWASEAERQRLHHSHIWNVANSTTAKTLSPPLKWQGQRAEAEPGTKACIDFNNFSCYKQEEHPDNLHICQYCLSKENSLS